MSAKQDQKIVLDALATNDAEYIERLAEGFYYGRGRDKSLKAAVQLWERAAELNNADALYYSGVCRYYGDGMERNKNLAFCLWQRAAEFGHIGAEMSLVNLKETEHEE